MNKIAKDIIGFLFTGAGVALLVYFWEIDIERLGLGKYVVGLAALFILDGIGDKIREDNE